MTTFSPPFLVLVSLLLVLPIYLCILIPLLGCRTPRATVGPRQECESSRGVAVGVLGCAVLFHVIWTWLASSEGNTTPTILPILLLTNLLLVPFFWFWAYSLRLSFGIFLQQGKPQVSMMSLPVQSQILPSVAVVIPCRNEPFDVLCMTIESALALDYPSDRLQVIVADNSDEGHSTLEELSHYIHMVDTGGRRISLLHRTGTIGFKAGNLDLAMRQVDAELTLFLDVDSSVPPRLLIDNIGPFLEHPRLAFLQFFCVPTNEQVSQFAMLTSYSLALHKSSLLLRSYLGGWPYYQGHNCIWRTSCLRSIAPLSEQLCGQDILVEDASMTLRTNRQGFYGYVLDYPAGYWMPTRLADLESMLVRWSYGGAQLLFREACFMLKQNRSSLLLGEYLDMYFHFVYSKLQALFPFLLLTISFSPAGTTFLVVIWALQTLLLDSSAILFGPLRRYLRDRGFRWAMAHFFMFSNFHGWCELRATLEALVQRRVRWIPTGKSRGAPVRRGLLSLSNLQQFKLPVLLYGGIFLLCPFYLKETFFLAPLPLISQALGVLVMIFLYNETTPSYPQDLTEYCSIRRWLSQSPS